MDNYGLFWPGPRQLTERWPNGADTDDHNPFTTILSFEADMADERTTTLQGNPLALTGAELKAGDAAPDFELTANDMSAVNLAAPVRPLESSYGSPVSGGRFRPVQT